MILRCHLTEGQSHTNNSNRKYLTISAHGKNYISCLVTKQRRQMKTTFGINDQTFYILYRQRRWHRETRSDKQLFVVSDISSWLYVLGKHTGPDILHFIKVVINVICLSSVALPCVFRFAVFFVLKLCMGLIF